MFLIAVVLAAPVPGATLSVSEFQPNIVWGGRATAIDVDPNDPTSSIAIAGTGSGGLFRTTDSGATWSHIDALPPFRMVDVKIDPNDSNIVIATAGRDTRVINQGGIWVSGDGGRKDWRKPASADPPCSFSQAWGISFVPRSSDVFVGTDCGLAVSHDNGATWTHVFVSPSGRAVFGVVAQRATPSTVDSCGPDGHHRSEDGGLSWTPTRFPSAQDPTALPPCIASPDSIAVSPLEPDVLFAAAEDGLYESDDGGASWSNLNAPPPAPSAAPRRGPRTRCCCGTPGKPPGPGRAGR